MATIGGKTYTMGRPLIQKFGGKYIHNNRENFLNFKTEIYGRTGTVLLNELKEEVENTLIAHRDFLLNEAGALTETINKARRKHPDWGDLTLDTLLKNLNNTYQQVKGNEDLPIYYLDKAKDAILKLRSLKEKKFTPELKKKIQKSFQEMEKAFVWYFQISRELYYKGLGSAVPTIDYMRQLESLLSPNTGGAYFNDRKMWDLIYLANPNFLKLKSYVDGNEIIDIKKILVLLRGSNSKTAIDNAINTIVGEGGSLIQPESPMGFGFEEGLYNFFIDEALKDVVGEGYIDLERGKDAKNIATELKNEAIIDLSLALKKLNAGFGVKHYDDYTKTVYNTPATLDVLFSGIDKELQNEFEYLKNNYVLFNKWSNTPKFIKDIERELIIFRGFSRFIDTFIKKTSKGQILPISIETGQETKIEHSLFWLTKSNIFWTHEIIDMFLQSPLSLSSKEKSLSDENKIFNISFSGTNKYGKAKEADLNKLKDLKKPYKEEGYGRIFHGPGVEEKMNEIIEDLGTRIPFYKKVIYTMRFKNFHKFIKK